jgi:hypothetical protein
MVESTDASATPLKSWVFWIPTIISLVALGGTVAQWLEAREQRHQQFDAALAFEVDTIYEKNRSGIGIRNTGPGVARVKEVTYFVDRVPVPQEEMDSLVERAKLNPDRDDGIALDEGDPLAPGELVWLINYRSIGRAEEARARDFFDNHLTAQIEYCTPNGDCSKLCSTKGGCN